MRVPQPLTLAGCFLLGVYAGSLGVVWGLARALVRDRHGELCKQAH